METSNPGAQRKAADDMRSRYVLSNAGSGGTLGGRGGGRDGGRGDTRDDGR